MWANNVALTHAENHISISSAKKQLAVAPYQTGKSGYPHIYENLDHFFHRPEGTTLMEFPIFGVETIRKKAKLYKYASKPKERPGPFRAIATSTDKTYVGIISYNGEPGKPAMAGFHCVHKAEAEEPGELDDEELEEGEVKGEWAEGRDAGSKGKGASGY